MAYDLSTSHMIDDTTWLPKVLWGSTVGYPSDSLASCLSPPYRHCPRSSQLQGSQCIHSTGLHQSSCMFKRELHEHTEVKEIHCVQKTTLTYIFFYISGQVGSVWITLLHTWERSRPFQTLPALYIVFLALWLTALIPVPICAYDVCVLMTEICFL